MNKWKQSARLVGRDAHALYLAARDPRVPWYAKALAVAVAAYALSPIDLIPDFIPVLGYLDDLIIVPLGIALVVRMIPPHIMAEHRALADAVQHRPVSRAAAIVIVAVWILTLALAVWMAIQVEKLSFDDFFTRLSLLQGKTTFFAAKQHLRAVSRSR